MPNVFIVGINGRVAKRHVTAWNKLGWNVYGCGSDNDYHPLIKNPAVKYDIIDICTPIYLHHEMIKYSNALGYPVICEKPLTLTDRQAHEIMELKGKIGIVYQFRYNPKIIKLKKELEDKKFGEIKLVTVNYYRWRGEEYYNKWEGEKFKAGGGVLFNVCIHYIDLLQWLFGYPIKVKGLSTTSKGHLDIEDNVVSIIKFPNGAIGSVILSSHVNPPKHMELSVYGTEGHKTIQLRQNEYHYRFFEEFIKDGEYTTPHDAYKSFKIVKDIYADSNS